VSSGEPAFRGVAVLEATYLLRELEPVCEKVAIAGSIVRCVEEVGDIEIVAIPKWTDVPGDDLFRTPVRTNLLELHVAKALREGDASPSLIRRHPKTPKDGPRYKLLWHRGADLALDLFIITSLSSWGTAMVIRTGPAEFSKYCVTRMRRFGLRCEGLEIKNEQDEVIPCPTEREFFRLCNLRYALPCDRRAPMRWRTRA